MRGEAFEGGLRRVGKYGTVLAEQIQTAELGDRFEEVAVAAGHVLEGVVGVAGCGGDHAEVATTELGFAIVDGGGDAVEVREHRLHPAPVPSFEPGVAHPEDLLDAGELGAELCDARLAHTVVAEDEEGGEHAVMAGFRRVRELLVE